MQARQADKQPGKQHQRSKHLYKSERVQKNEREPPISDKTSMRSSQRIRTADKEIPTRTCALLPVKPTSDIRSKTSTQRVSKS